MALFTVENFSVKFTEKTLLINSITRRPSSAESRLITLNIHKLSTKVLHFFLSQQQNQQAVDEKKNFFSLHRQFSSVPFQLCVNQYLARLSLCLISASHTTLPRVSLLKERRRKKHFLSINFKMSFIQQCSVGLIC
jgi:hypothetical protein